MACFYGYSEKWNHLIREWGAAGGFCNHITITCVWLLNPAAKCAILSIEKGKAIEAALPTNSYNLTLIASAVTTANSGGYFFFPL